ncbi:MAG: hypothetical protein V3S28_02630 [Acidimicrobiia bacterium]
MSRLSTAVGTSAFLAAAFGSMAFVIDSGPIIPSASLMIFVGMTGVALGGLAGLLLVRARWARWVLGTVVVGSVLLASIGGTALFWISLVLGAVAIVGLAGPWLTLWVRQQPVADQLGSVPVALMASGAFTPIIVGFAAWDSVALVHWALVVIVIVSGWAYGRGLPFGIWGFRLVVPIVGLQVVLHTSRPGSFVIAGGITVVAGLAWSGLARKVTAVITPPLPSPVNRKGPKNAG